MPNLDPFEGPEFQQQQQVPPPMIQTQTSYGSNNTPGAKEMDAAYKVSKELEGLVRERMERENPEDVEILDSITESDKVCVRRTYIKELHL